MTHPTSSETTFNEEELDALVEWLDNLFAMLEEEGYYTKANTADFARKAITALRTQLAEVMAQNERLWVANERLVKQLDEASAGIDRIAVEREKYKSACVMHRDKVQELILDVIPEATARADRAEAALAAQPSPDVAALVEALEALIQQTYDCEKELTEVLHHIDFCGESEPLAKARAALASVKGGEA